MQPPDPIWGQCFSTVTTGDNVNYVATLACVPYLVKNVIDVAISLAGAVAVFFIVWGGIQYIRSGGDPKQAEGARHTITYAIIGLIVILMAYFILSVISQLTGAECIKSLGFTNCQSPTSASSGSASENFSSEVSSPQTGDLGCFYGQSQDDGQLSSDTTCHGYDPSFNNPKTASKYFRGESAAADCSSYCEAQLSLH